MGRRIRWLYYYFKKLLVLAAIGWVLWLGFDYLSVYYDSGISDRAQQIRPYIQEVDAAGMEKFLRQPGQNTLIFIYSSRSMLSRWYFDNLNKIAGKYAPNGVRALFISVDPDANQLAEFLAAQGSLNFVPLHMSEDQARRFPDVIGMLGGDSVGGLLPYMGFMNAQLFIYDFTAAIIRTGKIEDIINQSLRGG